MTVIWRGREVADKVRRAEILGVNAILSECVSRGKREHAWLNRTGRLMGSIAIAEYAHKSGNGVAGIWGSRLVNYALKLELSPRYMWLRPVADATYPGLAGAIQRALAVAGT